MGLSFNAFTQGSNLQNRTQTRRDENQRLQNEQQQQLVQATLEGFNATVDETVEMVLTAKQQGLDPNTSQGQSVFQPIMEQIAAAAQRIKQTVPGADITTPLTKLKLALESPGREQQLEQEAESLRVTEGAKEEGKLEARRNNIDQILTRAEGNGTQEAFVEEAGSRDARRISGLFSQAQRLFAAGETGLANNALAQARFLAENSPEVQRQKELDKPVSDRLASQLGVPVGTTMGEVMDLTPPSPAELSEQQAVGGARGRGRVDAEEQISFIGQANAIIDTLRDELSIDPGLVGAQGSLRATGQTALGVLSDLGAERLLNTARDLAANASDLPEDEFKSLFESDTLSTLKLTENSLGLILARLRTPSGRIPVDVIRRSIDDVKLRGLTSSKQVQARLNFVKTLLDARQQSIEQRFGIESEGGSPPSANIPRFRVNEQGQLEQL